MIGALPSMIGALPSMIGALPSMIGALPSMIGAKAPSLTSQRSLRCPRSHRLDVSLVILGGSRQIIE